MTLPSFFWHVSMYLVGTSLKSGRFEENPTRSTSQTNALASHDVKQDTLWFLQAWVQIIYIYLQVLRQINISTD